MDFKEQARIVAFARLLGASGSDKEIYDKYSVYYQSALKSLSEPQKANPVEVIKRPF